MQINEAPIGEVKRINLDSCNAWWVSERVMNALSHDLDHGRVHGQNLKVILL